MVICEMISRKDNGKGMDRKKILFFFWEKYIFLYLGI